MSTGKWVLGVLATGLLAVSGIAVLQAQDMRTEPTAEIEEPPRTFEEVGHQRGGARPDSTIAGAITGAPHGQSRVTLPAVCDLDPGAYGCPSFCDHNPSHELCVDDGGGSGGGTTPPPSGGGPMEWCGVPYAAWPAPQTGSELYGVQEKCSPVSGGWHCGSGLYQDCP